MTFMNFKRKDIDEESKKTERLSLNKETIRFLTDDEAEMVGGGSTTGTNICSADTFCNCC